MSVSTSFQRTRTTPTKTSFTSLSSLVCPPVVGVGGWLFACLVSAYACHMPTCVYCIPACQCSPDKKKASVFEHALMFMIVRFRTGGPAGGWADRWIDGPMDGCACSESGACWRAQCTRARWSRLGQARAAARLGQRPRRDSAAQDGRPMRVRKKDDARRGLRFKTGIRPCHAVRVMERCAMIQRYIYRSRAIGHGLKVMGDTGHEL